MRLSGTANLHLGELLPPLLACGLYLILYRRRARTLAVRGAPVGRARRIAFVSGAVLTPLVQLPPIDGLGDSLLIAHMLQHIVIGDIASLLLVLGLTGPMLAPLLRVRVTRTLRPSRLAVARGRSLGVRPLRLASATALPVGDQI